MNNKTFSIVAGLIVIAGIVVWLMMSGRGDQGNQLMNSSNSTQTGNVSESRTLKELLASGQTQKCEFTNGGDEENPAGATYIGRGMMRGDYTMTSAGKQVGSHMVIKDQTSYIWMDGTDIGFKTSLAETEGAANTTGSQNVDMDKKTDYHCEPWSADNSMFDLPSAVTFKDMQSMMKAATDTGTPSPSPSSGPGTSAQDLKAMQCGACDQAPEESKAQCRAALGC